jgi:mannosidase alpha-like ER degradation enhancer 2
MHVRQWTESVSGLGSNADSYFEYLLKMYLLFGDPKWWWAFLESVGSIDAHLRRGDWFIDVDTYSGQPRRQRFENLMAFWPGVQVI